MPKAYQFSTNILRDFTTHGVFVACWVSRLASYSILLPSMLNVKTNWWKPCKLSLFLTEIFWNTPLNSHSLKELWYSIHLLSFFSFISFPRPFPVSPPFDSLFSTLLSWVEWELLRRVSCCNGNWVPWVPTACPWKLFILSLVTPENNYFKDQSQCLIFQFISLPPFFAKPASVPEIKSELLAILPA